jgi:hypothetical protein
MKKLLENFIETFCTKASEDEDSATTELYMDDHDCIEYDGKQYYVPQNNSFYTEDDELIRQFLISVYGL